MLYSVRYWQHRWLCVCSVHMSCRLIERHVWVSECVLSGCQTSHSVYTWVAGWLSGVSEWVCAEWLSDLSLSVHMSCRLIERHVWVSECAEWLSVLSLRCHSHICALAVGWSSQVEIQCVNADLTFMMKFRVCMFWLDEIRVVFHVSQVVCVA